MGSKSFAVVVLVDGQRLEGRLSEEVVCGRRFLRLTDPGEVLDATLVNPEHVAYFVRSETLGASAARPRVDPAPLDHLDRALRILDELRELGALPRENPAPQPAFDAEDAIAVATGESVASGGAEPYLLDFSELSSRRQGDILYDLMNRLRRHLLQPGFVDLVGDTDPVADPVAMATGFDAFSDPADFGASLLGDGDPVAESVRFARPQERRDPTDAPKDACTTAGTPSIH